MIREKKREKEKREGGMKKVNINEKKEQYGIVIKKGIMEKY